MTRALLVEPQTLFAPYFARVIENAGSQVVVAANASRKLLRALRPHLIVVDAGHAAPLRLVRRIRASAPHARIVLFVRELEPGWDALARALGADAVVGPASNEADLVAALAA